MRLLGGSNKTATFDMKPEAWAERMEAKKRLGKFSPSRAVGVTVGELFEAYLDAVASQTDSGKWNGLRLMKWCKDPLANKRLADILTHDINEWIEGSLAQPSDGTKKASDRATVNREFNLTSAAFNHAVKECKWIEVNPCPGARSRSAERPEMAVDPSRNVPLAARDRTARPGAGQHAQPYIAARYALQP